MLGPMTTVSGSCVPGYSLLNFRWEKSDSTLEDPDFDFVCTKPT